MSKFTGSFVMKLHERVELANGKKENKEVGKATIPCPILADFGVTAEQSKDKEGNLAFENGMPLYSDPRMDFLQSAVINMVALRNRNKFEKGKLRDGAELASDFDTLFEQSGGAGDALALRREARTSFELYLQQKGKKAAIVTLLSDIFQNSAKVLNGAADKVVQALSAHVEGWIDTLSEEQQARFMPKIKELQESINTAVKGVDLEDLAA